MTANARSDYTTIAKWIHWGSAAVWIASWLMGFIAVHWREELNPHHGLTAWHKGIATLLLFLIVVRVAWRIGHPAPALPATMSPFIRSAAHVGHVALYVLALAALPLSGWFWSSVADKPVFVMGMFPLPPLTRPWPEMYYAAKQAHAISGWFAGVLVVGHVAASLKHHFLDRDDVLNLMLPRRRT
jgi:cytochrome b561